MASMIAVDKNYGQIVVSRTHLKKKKKKKYESSSVRHDGPRIAAAARSAFGQAPSWSQFKPLPGSLKEKMHSGQQVRIGGATCRHHASQLQELIKKNGDGWTCSALDAQHRPLPDERELVKFCKLAEELGAGVQLRIQHPKWAYMTGRYADLGVLAVMVPLVEEVETADEAINNFYYPPLGNRSWGGEFRYGEKPPTDRLKYAQWWNGNGTAGFPDRNASRRAQRAKHRQTGRRLDLVGTWGHGVRHRAALQQPVQDDRRGPCLRDRTTEGL